MAKGKKCLTKFCNKVVCHHSYILHQRKVGLYWLEFGIPARVPIWQPEGPWSKLATPESKLQTTNYKPQIKDCCSKIGNKFGGSYLWYGLANLKVHFHGRTNPPYSLPHRPPYCMSRTNLSYICLVRQAAWSVQKQNASYRKSAVQGAIRSVTILITPLTSFCVAVESSSLAYSISLDLLHIMGHLNIKKNTFFIADYLRFPGLNFGAIFSVTRYVENAGLHGNGIHMTYATYMVYVVQNVVCTAGCTTDLYVRGNRP
jgi:hypothetical protein